MIARAIADSVGFLTILPMGGRRRAAPPADLTTAAFPLTGLLIGFLALPVALLPVDPLLRAALVLALWVAVTGGLHEDGWMDSMDAALAPVDRERRIAILKDPRVGAHGLTTMLALALVRYSALATVPPVAVILAPVVGRWAMVVSLARFRPAREEGLGVMLATDARPVAATGVAAVILLVLGTATGSAWPAVAWLAGGAAALAIGRFLAARLGGLNGDGHGAVGLFAEVTALVAYAVAPEAPARFSWAG